MQRLYAGLVALCTVVSCAAALEVGDPAPPVKLPDQDGQIVDVANNYGKWTVLAFYPADSTSGCTLEAKNISENWEALRAAGVEVYGVSTQGVESKKAFCESAGLRQTMLSDVDKSVSAAYGVLIPDRGIANRWTFYIDPSRTVRAIDREVKVGTHGADILARIGQYKDEDAAALGVVLDESHPFGGLNWRLPIAWTGGGQTQRLPAGVTISKSAHTTDDQSDVPDGAKVGLEESFLLDDVTVTRREFSLGDRFTAQLLWEHGPMAYHLVVSGPEASAPLLRSLLASMVG